MVLSVGSLPSGAITRRLEDLRKLALKHNGGSNGQNESRSEREQAECLQLAEALFARAPEDYLERTGVEDMLQTAEQVYHFYLAYLASDKKTRVSVSRAAATGQKRPTTIIMTAVKDRPFIIDTLTELLRTESLEAYVYLHPIFRHSEGERISIVYIEAEPIESESRRKALAATIEQALDDLILVTDDFPAMLSHVETLAETLSNSAVTSDHPEAERTEYARFLRWLADEGFVFFGYKKWTSAGEGSTINFVEEEQLGLFRSKNADLLAELEDTKRDTERILETGELLSFSKVLIESRLHRRARMDLVTVSIPEANGKGRQIYSILGLLTSKSISQEASSVPLIRVKLERILKLEGFLPNSHAYKEVISIANSIPKADLLRFSLEGLRKEIALIFDVQRRDKVRVGWSQDPLRRFVTCSVVMPREKFSQAIRQGIQDEVEKIVGTRHRSSEYQLAVGDYPLVVIRLLVPNPTLKEHTPDLAAFEARITELSLSWDDKLLALLTESNSDSETIQRLYSFYHRAYPEQYKACTSPAQAVQDIASLEKLDVDHPLELSLERDSEPGLYILRLYKRGESITLSAILPFLENTGFDIHSEAVTPVATEGSVWAAIYELSVRPSRQREIPESVIKEALLPGLKLVLEGVAENDALNRLMMHPGLSCNEIAILRTLSHYLWQIKATTSDHTIADALAENPELAELTVNYFATKFDPDLFPGEDIPARLARLEKLEAEFVNELKNVKQLVHDRSLRALLNVIQATVRTNYYQDKDPFRIALKIECARINQMPSPRPMYETFVSSPLIAGVHLRGGKVARGGLRWSDRIEDYRTEVLGLLKTQMVKNSIIVPVGAKGGFIVKQPPKDPKAMPATVKDCYKQFIRSLLELADNRINGELITPPRTVIYDGEDSYLVVAADRGTATFSDTANEIAQKEFNFWLSDAFASGGSAGYDHKKYGITARGAWETTCRHFREIGIDPDTQEFTVVGIGDMSGDVFGNGLLRSDNAKLIAAFNHKHIFIDPTPDSKRSFAERKRLFELPQSNWTDFEPEIISAGGGVFNRSEKEIQLSAQAREALGIEEEVLSGEALIRAILKAPVDLLWNGGIGTYIKSYEETDLDVGDRANDDVRVDARELRAKVIGEGGNLGLTQLARIEYSRIGGHCNTDAVDNSGGVDLSDFEVNMKILLSAPVRRGALSIEERNTLLMSCADAACEKVINRNRTQSKSISLAVRRSRKNIGYYRGLLDSLEKEGLLDRQKEALPDDEVLLKRSAMKAGLTRPELAVLGAYTKMSLYGTLIKSSLPEDPFLQKYLLAYFPQLIREKYTEDILQHPLRREIIGTQVANSLAERMGGSFVYRSAEETGLAKTDVIRAFLAADEIIGADEVTAELRILDRANVTRTHLQTLLRLQTAIDNMTRWFLENYSRSRLSLTELVEKYREPFRRLTAKTDSLIPEAERAGFLEAYRLLIGNDVPKDTAVRVASVAYATPYLDIVDIASETSIDVLEIASVYSHLAVALHLRQLLEQASDLEPADRWEALAVRSLMAELRGSVARLTKRIVTEIGTGPDVIERYLSDRSEITERYRASVHEFNSRAVSVPALLVISKQLANLSKNY